MNKQIRCPVSLTATSRETHMLADLPKNQGFSLVPPAPVAAVVQTKLLNALTDSLRSNLKGFGFFPIEQVVRLNGN